MHLGIDLGTSAVKAVLTGMDGTLLAQASAPVPSSFPRPLWSEQDPGDWWRATGQAVAGLGMGLSRVRGIGLSGQMHGAVLLDAADRVLRPAILWNDGRCAAECGLLEAAGVRAATGNLAMPGFTAPKLLWVRHHEPGVFAAARRCCCLSLSRCCYGFCSCVSGPSGRYRHKSHTTDTDRLFTILQIGRAHV